MNDPIINFEKLDYWRQIDPASGYEFLEKLISIYISSTPAFQTQIENAIQTGDSDALVKAAHTFKSSATNIGAESLASICQQMEEYGAKSELIRAAELLEKMHSESRRVITALEDLSGKF